MGVSSSSNEVCAFHPASEGTYYVIDPAPEGTCHVMVHAAAAFSDLTLVGQYDESQTEWKPTGSLRFGRSGHTATLLPSGKILVAGGDDVASLASAELYDPATGAWTITGSLTTARDNHTATLLPTGKVLVVGGHDTSALSSAELYDPGTGTWENTGSLQVARSGHTATQLPSGDVLVVGGAGAELYDTSAGTWHGAGTLTTPRITHTATLLASGKVLVVGGFYDGPTLSSAELYDPEWGTWESTGSLATSRREHTATLLASGKVLVVGGWDSVSFSRLSSAELYDPATGAWTSTGSLLTAREEHTATLLPSGKVLVAAGSAFLASVEIYDPDLGTWQSTGSLATDRYRHTMTLLPGGQVLVAGGSEAVDSLSSVEIYDPTQAVWATGASLLTGRYGHTATLLGSGQVLAAGGGQSAELYDPSPESWHSTASLSAARRGHTATLLPSGKVLVVGGETDAFVIVSTGELYDPDLGSWESTDPLAARRIEHTATLLASGKVLVAGGDHGFNSLKSSELYDGETWTPTTGSLASGRKLHTATLLLAGEVLVAGGETGISALASAELYDPRKETWRSTGFLREPRSNHTATLLPSGEVLVAGGANASFDYLASAEIYDPQTETWRNTAPLAVPRVDHTAILLPSGQVMIAGGTTVTGSLFYPLSSVEIFDPSTETWHQAEPLATARELHTATLLLSGEVLVAGGWNGSVVTPYTSVELYEVAGQRAFRPVLQSASPLMRYGEPLVLTGTGFRGDSEASGGTTRGSAVNYPLVELRNLTTGHTSWLSPASRSNFWDDPMTLEVRNLPPTLYQGQHLLSVVTAGLRSESLLVALACSVAIDRQPSDQTAELGESVTFEVLAQGGRYFQWRRDGVDVPGATAPSYVTPPIIAADAGTTYSVVVDSGCTQQVSTAAILHVTDDQLPTAEVLAPSGGEYWVLSEPDAEPGLELVTWEMADNIRICQVEVALLYSDDGGVNYREAPSGGGLPATLGPGGACSHPNRVATTSVAYTVPTAPPAGTAGSLYKVRVAVTDQAGNTTTVKSASPFFIVRPNPDTVKTLILAHLPRMQAVMGITPAQAGELGTNLQDLAHHPRVLGLVVDLAGVTDLVDLYAAWDAERGSPERANQVLFGCHAPLPPGCTVEKDGIHDLLRDLLRAYAGVESVVLVGDDRILPLARIQDRTILFSEQSYPEPLNGDLTADGTTVGQALAANKYLSDDPLAVLDPIHSEELSGSLFIPDVAVGRLVETPEEIITTIATFISQDGVLDLSDLDPAAGHKVQVNGYDFLLDSATRIRERWKGALGQLTPPESPAPVDGELIGQSWDEVDLLTHLCGNGGAPYGLVSLNGHAVHYAEGVPASDPFDVRGLATADLMAGAACGSGPLDLSGSVLYAVGCHGGLPVAGSDPLDADHSLDLPQSYLSRGAVVYVANSGYGWGLRHGIGYGERLVELFTEEISRGGGAIAVGAAVREAKLRYFLEAPRFDPYDEKTLMQWTLFGLPMYAVDTGIGATAAAPAERGAVETLGPVTVERRLTDEVAGARSGLPAYLTRLQLHFDLTAPGVYTKYNASGEVLGDVAGCPPPAPGEPEGCYYTLNGLVERGTGIADHPIQPYFIYDSRLSGTSQHGILWMGGAWDEEDGWVPVIAELVSNGGDGSDAGAAPRLRSSKPHGPRIVPGQDPPACRPSDLEVNSMVVTTGEAAKAELSDPTCSLERLYRELDLEILYFNNTAESAQNCDRTGPQLLPGPFGGDYHQLTATTVQWAVPASDPAGVWRLVVVYDDGDLDAQGRGRWVPLELWDDGRTWRGSLTVAGAGRLTYMLQAVDRRGNVSWLDYVTTDLPASGVPLGLPYPVDVEVTLGTADLSLTTSDVPDPVAVGGILTYTLAVSNQGPDAASSVSVADALPPGTTLVLAGGEGWVCAAAGGVVTCERELLAAGESAAPISVVVIAPPGSGTIHNAVAVEAAQEDPNTANNTVVEETQVTETVVDATPPVVEYVHSVASSGGGRLDDGETTAAAVTQLLVTFSEPVVLATGGGYLLVAAGGDGVFQSSTCAGGRQGDDVTVAIDELLIDGTTVVLRLHGSRALAQGACRLLICSGFRDLAGNSLAETRHEFTITVEHLLVNPNFDRDLGGWLINPPAGISRSAEDVDGAATSGSALVADPGGVEAASLSQCVAGVAGTGLAFGGAVRIVDGGAEGGTVLALVEVFAAADCSGEPFASSTTALGGEGGSLWQRLPRGMLAVPAGAGSVLISFVVEATAGSDVLFDDLCLYPVLFADGFESGDASRWSVAVP